MNILTQNNITTYKCRNKKSMTREYSIWSSMIARCYGKQSATRYPAYVGCTVADEWLEFQAFEEWLKSNNFYVDGYDLDKDIVVPNNRIYSPKRCVLVPREINCLFRGSSRRNYNLPTGVHYQKRNKHKKYGASIYIGKSKPRIHLGYFKTIQEAHMAYAVEKEGYAKRLANKWRGRIDERVYDALMNWTVNP